jgi:WD40 repeat protein
LAPAQADGKAVVLNERANVPFASPNSVREISWSPNGRFVALGASTGYFVCVVDLGTGKQLFQNPGATGGWGFLSNAAFVTIDRGEVAEKALIAVDLKTGRVVQGRSDTIIYRCAVAPDGQSLAAITSPLDTDTWATVLATGANLNKPNAVLLKRKATLLAYSPDGKRLAVSDDGEVHLFAVAARKEEPTTAAHASRGLLFRDDGNALVCWDQEKLYISDLTTGQLRQEQSLRGGHVGRCLAAAVHPAKPLFVTAGEHGDLLVKDLKTGAVKQRVALGPDPATALSFSPDGKFLIGCLGAGEGAPRLLKVWTVAD